MDIATLTEFFRLCTLINGAILIYASLVFWLAPNLIYRIQRHWVQIPQATFNITYYAFLGLFKLFFILFNLTPYLALSIIGWET